MLGDEVVFVSVSRVSTRAYTTPPRMLPRLLILNLCAPRKPAVLVPITPRVDVAMIPDTWPLVTARVVLARGALSTGDADAMATCVADIFLLKWSGRLCESRASVLWAEDWRTSPRESADARKRDETWQFLRSTALLADEGPGLIDTILGLFLV
jgi:hypothetical protein